MRVLAMAIIPVWKVLRTPMVGAKRSLTASAQSPVTPAKTTQLAKPAAT